MQASVQIVGEKIDERTDARWRACATHEHRMDLLDIAGIEVFQDGNEPTAGDLMLYLNDQPA
jgi:hypothetical protein